MCGRTSIAINKKALENYYGAKFIGDFTPLSDARPSQNLPIVRNIEPKIIRLAKWGLMPKWLAEKRKTGIINSRAETIFEKPSFRNSVLNKRCLVPAVGFYEWQGEKGHRRPYFIKLKNQPLLSLAGIWESWLDKSGNDFITYSIITTNPNELIREIHDRMPVILSRKEEKIWLDNTTEKNELIGLMDAYPAQMMEAKKV